MKLALQRLFFLLLLCLVLHPTPAHAVPLAQGDNPVDQCVRGGQLFMEGKYAEAFPLLEAGFTNRKKAKFARADDLGLCALILGNLYKLEGKIDQAREAFVVAVDAFKESKNSLLEGITLNNIGETYRLQGSYIDAEIFYQQAFILQQKIGDKAGQGITLNNIGLTHWAQGKPDAISYYERSWKIMKEVGDSAGAGIVLDNIGQFYRSQGKYNEAMKYYQQALSIAVELVNSSSECTVLNNIGELYMVQGRYDDALENFHQSLLISRNNADYVSEGIALNNIGEVYRLQAQYEKSLNNFEQSLEIANKIGDRAGYGTTLNNIGLVYQAKNQVTEALKYYRQAQMIAKEMGNPRIESASLHNIAGVYAYQGRYTESLQNYQLALDILRRVGDLSKEDAVLHGMGMAYFAQGKYDRALEFYGQALEIVRKMRNRAGEGATLNSIGMVYHTQGRYADALVYYQQALLISRELGDKAGEGNTLINIGEIYRMQSRDVDAIKYYQDALMIQQILGDRDGEAVALNNIGLIYQSQNQYGNALNYYHDALIIHQTTGNKGGEAATLHNIGLAFSSQKQYMDALKYYQDALKIRRDIGNLQGEGVTLSGIAGVYLAQKQYVKALDYFEQARVIQQETKDKLGESATLNNIGVIFQELGKYDQALEYYEKTLDLLESIRASAGNDTDRASFIDNYSAFYDRSIELYYQQNFPERAFIISERGRARAFLDSMSTGYVEVSGTEVSVLYSQERENYHIRQVAQDVVTQAKAQIPPNENLIADLETQLAEAEKDYQVALDAISARGDQLQQLVPGRSKVLDVSQAQALLDDQTTLLSFWVLDEQTLVFILTPKTFNIVALHVDRKDLYAQIQAFLAFSSTDTAYPETAMILYKALIEPLKSQLTTANLIIVPQGELHYLPFAALTDGNQYLVDEYNISYLPSVSALPFIRENTQAKGEDALSIGNPTTGNTQLAPLPFAEQEVKVIAKLYGIKPFIGATATESQVKESVSQAGILHLAVHGTYNEINPLYSTLYLTPDAQNDGLLEVHEIYGLDLHKTNLVVLSACETQMGQLSRGDELVGLTRAFFFAGTPTVVASLWSVDDQSTAILMEQFYTHIRGGMGKAESLRQAQLGVREKYPNPYYWAGFVLSGDGGKINEPALIFWPWVILIVVICGFILGGFLCIRRRKKTI